MPKLRPGMQLEKTPPPRGPRSTPTTRGCWPPGQGGQRGRGQEGPATRSGPPAQRGNPGPTPRGSQSPRLQLPRTRSASCACLPGLPRAPTHTAQPKAAPPHCHAAPPQQRQGCPVHSSKLNTDVELALCIRSQSCKAGQGPRRTAPGKASCEACSLGSERSPGTCGGPATHATATRPRRVLRPAPRRRVGWPRWPRRNGATIQLALPKHQAYKHSQHGPWLPSKTARWG